MMPDTIEQQLSTIESDRLEWLEPRPGLATRALRQHQQRHRMRIAGSIAGAAVAIPAVILVVTMIPTSSGPSALRPSATSTPTYPAVAVGGHGYTLRYASNDQITIDHNGVYTWNTRTLPISRGLPGSTGVGGYITPSGAALVGNMETRQEYTTAGTYLHITFAVSNLRQPAVYHLSAAAAPLPPSAATPSLTPPG